MRSGRATIIGLVLLAGLGCAASRPDPSPAAEGAEGTTTQAYCGGLYATHVVRRDGTVFFISPDSLATATDGCGPQALSLSDSQSVSPQITYQQSPSLSKSKNDITRTVQQAVSFSLSTSITLTASTVVLVPADAYYRLEAYPEYEVTDYELRADGCGFQPDVSITTGSVYRPAGVHFRVLELIGAAWNALGPPSPAERLAPPPWKQEPATQGGGAESPDAGAQGDAGSP
jgi:hypothetical protein